MTYKSDIYNRQNQMLIFCLCTLHAAYIAMHWLHIRIQCVCSRISKSYVLLLHMRYVVSMLSAMYVPRTYVVIRRFSCGV